MHSMSTGLPPSWSAISRAFLTDSRTAQMSLPSMRIVSMP